MEDTVTGLVISSLADGCEAEAVAGVAGLSVEDVVAVQSAPLFQLFMKVQDEKGC